MAFSFKQVVKYIFKTLCVFCCIINDDADNTSENKPNKLQCHCCTTNEKNICYCCFNIYGLDFYNDAQQNNGYCIIPAAICTVFGVFIRVLVTLVVIIIAAPIIFGILALIIITFPAWFTIGIIIFAIIGFILLYSVYNGDPFPA